MVRAFLSTTRQAPSILMGEGLHQKRCNPSSSSYVKFLASKDMLLAMAGYGNDSPHGRRVRTVLFGAASRDGVPVWRRIVDSAYSEESFAVWRLPTLARGAPRNETLTPSLCLFCLAEREKPAGEGGLLESAARGREVARRCGVGGYLLASSFTTCRASVIVRPQATPCIWSG